ncbi:GntR family transcriptional regulator [Saccharopolyspora rosea]
MIAESAESGIKFVVMGDTPAAGSFSDEVADRLRERIMTGRLRAGDRLPLGRLATELGVSATPVREALLALRGEGFVELEPRRGFTVAALSRHDVEDAHRVQAGIAGELAARATRRITTAEITDLAALHDRMRSAARGASAEVGPLVRRFHDIVGELARSRKLLWFLGIALRYTPGRVTASLPGWPEMAVTDHHRILQAMSDGAPAAARAATQRHVVHSGRLLIHHLEQRGMWIGESENRPPGEEFRIT